MAADYGLTVSVSQIKEFLICPRRYQLHRLLAVEPAFTPVPLALGSAAHAAFGAIYTSIGNHGEVVPVDEAVQVFRDTWSVTAAGPVAIKLDEDEADAIDVGVRVVQAMHAHVVAAGPVDVVGVEVPFSGVQLHDPDTGEVLEERFGGFVDLVVREPVAAGSAATRAVIVEHKTAGRKWTRDQLDHDLQLTAYQAAAPALGLGDDVGLRYQIVTKAKVAAVQVEDVVRDDLAHVDFLRTAAGVLRAIGIGAFWPIKSWACKSCPFAHGCAGRRP
jgi:CRISPR/Cas system-associated exonuclease Cas4 (RecB family)